MRHGHGCHPHHAGHHQVHIGHNMHCAQHMHAAHHCHPCHPGPFQTGHFHSRGYGPTYFVGRYTEQHRPVLKVMLGVGIVFLTVSAVLLFCGILNLAGAIPGQTFRVGVPMMGFGAMILIGGVSLTLLARLSLRNLEQSLAAQQQSGGCTCTQPEQLHCNDGFSQSPGKSEFNHLPSSAPYGQPPHGAPCSQPLSSALYGQPPHSAPYGQSSSSAPYGQPPSSAPYGQPPNSAPYGQSPSSAAYGQARSSAPYGQALSSDPYGQAPSSAQSNSPSLSYHLPASAPPPYAESVYPGQAPVSS